MELPCSKWTHIAVGVKSREEAIEQMYAEYERHPGRRRKPALEAFEVYRAVQLVSLHYRAGTWLLFVRVRRRG